MKFLSVRTVYRVFPIIKHSKTSGPRLVPTPYPIDLKFQSSVCLTKDYRQNKYGSDRIKMNGDTVSGNASDERKTIIIIIKIINNNTQKTEKT